MSTDSSSIEDYDVEADEDDEDEGDESEEDAPGRTLNSSDSSDLGYRRAEKMEDESPLWARKLYLLFAHAVSATFDGPQDFSGMDEDTLTGINRNVWDFVKPRLRFDTKFDYGRCSPTFMKD